jgi:trans-aconitate methyltransferase
MQGIECSFRHAYIQRQALPDTGMDQRKATEVFHEWAEKGKDAGMERGHAPSVDVMLNLLLEGVDKPFSAIDIGCGNGWVVRKFAEHPLCNNASGIDGAVAMVEKAREIDPNGTYCLGQLPGWSPEQPVDLIHSMECLYYLKQPIDFLRNIHDNWMKSGGKMVIGMDHYKENPESHDWPQSLNVHMTTLSIDTWVKGLEDAGFEDVKAIQTGAKEGWNGTLVLSAIKPHRP